jgi:hypothetical protein
MRKEALPAIHPTDAVLARRVATVTCRASQFGAPADPRANLEAIDALAIPLAQQMVDGLVADSHDVLGGIPAAPSATLQAFQNHFGFPVPAGGGFLNRLTGAVLPTRELALSQELSIVSGRFAAVVREMTQGMSYFCQGNAALSLKGCAPAGTCNNADANSCVGNSLVGICPTFWTEGDFDDTARAQIIIHEALHIAFEGIGDDDTTRGSGRNFALAGFYEALIADITGANSHVDCPPVPPP